MAGSQTACHPTGRHVYETNTIKIARIFVKDRNARIDRKNFSNGNGGRCPPYDGAFNLVGGAPVPTLRVAQVPRKTFVPVLIHHNDPSIRAFAHADQ